MWQNEMEKTRIHIFKMAILVKNVGTYKKTQRRWLCYESVTAMGVFQCLDKKMGGGEIKNGNIKEFFL